TGRRPDELIGRKVFQVFHEKASHQPGESTRKITDSFRTVLSTGRPHRLKRLRFDLPGPDGGYEERHWMIENLPVLDEAGRVRLIINTPEDITAMVKLLDLEPSPVERADVDGAMAALDQQLATLRDLVEATTTPDLRAALLQLTDEIEAQCGRLTGLGV